MLAAYRANYLKTSGANGAIGAMEIALTTLLCISAGGASSTFTGGAGGGAIRIEAAGDIIVDGQITADGSMPGASYSSAGYLYHR